MKKLKSIFILAIIFSSFLYSSLLDIIKNEEEAIKYSQNIIKSDILIKKSKLIGVETLYKLNKNINFLKNIKKSSKEKSCILINEKAKRLDRSIPIANRLLEDGDITQNDYNKFITNLKEEKIELSRDIKLKKCN